MKATWRAPACRTRIVYRARSAPHAGLLTSRWCSQKRASREKAEDRQEIKVRGKDKGRAPTVDPRPSTPQFSRAQTRRSRGTQSGPRTVASFRTWRGLQTSAARGPNPHNLRVPKSWRSYDLGGEFSPAYEHFGFRAAQAPHLARPTRIFYPTPPPTSTRAGPISEAMMTRAASISSAVMP